MLTLLPCNWLGCQLVSHESTLVTIIMLSKQDVGAFPFFSYHSPDCFISVMKAVAYFGTIEQNWLTLGPCKRVLYMLDSLCCGSCYLSLLNLPFPQDQWFSLGPYANRILAGKDAHSTREITQNSRGFMLFSSWFWVLLISVNCSACCRER